MEHDEGFGVSRRKNFFLFFGPIQQFSGNGDTSSSVIEGEMGSTVVWVWFLVYLVFCINIFHAIQ